MKNAMVYCNNVEPFLINVTHGTDIIFPGTALELEEPVKAKSGLTSWKEILEMTKLTRRNTTPPEELTDARWHIGQLRGWDEEHYRRNNVKLPPSFHRCPQCGKYSYKKKQATADKETNEP